MDRLICKDLMIRLKMITILLCIVILVAEFSLSYAGEKYGVSATMQETVTQITVNSVNLTAEKFFKSYISDSADERKKAELYLLGVMDTTEGRFWCDYRTFKTITLRERIYEELKKLNRHQLNMRASKIIEHILSTRYPCERKNEN